MDVQVGWVTVRAVQMSNVNPHLHRQSAQVLMRLSHQPTSEPALPVDNDTLCRFGAHAHACA